MRQNKGMKSISRLSDIFKKQMQSGNNTLLLLLSLPACTYLIIRVLMKKFMKRVICLDMILDDIEAGLNN